MAKVIETDVLIVGTGPAGGAMAALLSMYGIQNMVVTKWNWLCRTPRAHITNQRTMEVLRDLGVEQQVLQEASPQEIMGNNVFCTALAGDELGRLQTCVHIRRERPTTISPAPARCATCRRT